jgi:GT2 family glycosyltransferase
VLTLAARDAPPQCWIPVDLGIVIPSLNQARYLAAALDSVLSQRAVHVHLALMDGGSTDGSDEIVSRYRPLCAVCRMEPDGGHAAAVNEGIGRLLSMRPDIQAVGFLNADDLYLDGGLSALAEALDAHPDWVAAAGRAAIVDEPGRVLAEYPVGPVTRAAMARRCTICQPATLIRRGIWEQVKGLDVGFHMSLDYDLWWRLMRAGTIGCVDRVVAASRDHAATKTRTRRREYFQESMHIVERETGWSPWHWCISEALEQQAGWRMNPSLGPAAKLAAAARAASTYLRRNVLGRRT